jgi:uncharacterized membrane protein YfcA
MLTLVAVFAGGVVASALAAIGGGVGIISLPLLMVAGLSPQAAVAVSRVGLLGLTISGTYKFAREGKILWHYVLPLSVISIVGSIVGTTMLVSMDARLLNIVIGILMLATLPLLYVKKGTTRKVENKSRWLVCMAVYAVIRIYAGLFGGGAATLEFVVIERFSTMDIVEANGVTRIPSLLAAAVSVVMLIGSGMLEPKISLTLFASMLVGGYLGSHLAIKKGADWAKHLVTAMIIIVAIKLIAF